jgi:hypothetical protein
LPRESSTDERITTIPGCPYLDSPSEDLESFVQQHLECSRLAGSYSINPYHALSQGFHVTFFEIIETTEEAAKASQWKVGLMYYNVLDWRCPDKYTYIRRSSFSVRIHLSSDLKEHAKTTLGLFQVIER